MMADQFKNFLIGLFVTAAAGVIIFILMFLHPRIGDDGKLLHVRFTDIDKVTVGTRVTYAGKPVGEVIKIEEVEYGREGRTDASGRIYIYDLTLRVDSAVNVYNTDEISSRTSGLLGEKNIEITPMAPHPNQVLRIIDNQPIYALETGSVEDTFKEIKDVAHKIEKALDAAIDVINDIKEQHLVKKITHTVENLESITTSLNKPEEWSEILANVHTLSQRALYSWNNVDKALVSINNAAESAQQFMNQGHQTFLDVGSGKGTMGKLVANDELYLRFNSIMSKLETTMDDINHYGLLFHSNKGWQRLRARRLNLLQQLRTPQEFRNYFNDEIDQISTSISRVFMVLNEVGGDPYCTTMSQNPEFNKVFAELMRRVSMLEEEIRLYNIQITETEVHQTELGNPPDPACIQESSCSNGVEWYQ